MIPLAHGVTASRLDSIERIVLLRKQGLSMLEMEQALERVGLQVDGRRMNLAARAQAHLPVIASFPDHFVVVDRRAADGTWEIRDPSIGRVRFDASALQALWTGRVLEVESGPRLLAP